ncbi:DTW domain-containing protein [Shigella flexneri]
MTDNAVLQLRAERLARTTSPFLARGNRIRRCQRCLLPLKVCLCRKRLRRARRKATLSGHVRYKEPMKPSDAGRLIANICKPPATFQWSRTEPPQALLEPVANPDYQPMVVSPGILCGRRRQVLHRCRHPVSRRCLLCSTAPGPKREDLSQKSVSRCAAGDFRRSVARFGLSLT